MRMRFKYKRRYKKKYIINIILLILIVFIYRYISNISISTSNEELVKYLLSDIDNSNKIYNVCINKVRNIFNNPYEILKSQLNYNMNSTTISSVSFNYSENELPLVYIYNTHQNEEYSSKYLEDYNITPNVLTASLMLEEKLESIGINTLIEESNIIEYMNNNNLDHSKSYIASRHFLLNTINKYSSIKLYIDLHRDSILHDEAYIDINGIGFAKVLFVVGLEYDTYMDNLKVVEELNNKLNSKYPGLSRGIIKHGGDGFNGVYNQDINSNIILIEIGGYQNNIEEINNTLDALALVIGEYLNEKKE